MNKQLIAVAALVAFAASSQAAVTNTVSFKLKATVEVAPTTNSAGVIKYDTKSYKIVNADITGDKKAKIYSAGETFWAGTNSLPIALTDYASVEGGKWYSTNKSGWDGTAFTKVNYTKSATNKFDIYGLADYKGAESKNKEAESFSFKGTGYGQYNGKEAIFEGSVSGSGSIKK